MWRLAAIGSSAGQNARCENNNRELWRCALKAHSTAHRINAARHVLNVFAAHTHGFPARARPYQIPNADSRFLYIARVRAHDVRFFIASHVDIRNDEKWRKTKLRESTKSASSATAHTLCWLQQATSTLNVSMGLLNSSARGFHLSFLNSKKKIKKSRECCNRMSCASTREMVNLGNEWWAGSRKAIYRCFAIQTYVEIKSAPASMHLRNKKAKHFGWCGCHLTRAAPVDHFI